MSEFCCKRLNDDFRQLQIDKPYGLSATPTEEDNFIWDAIICGLKGTIYEGGIFKLKIYFPAKYPQTPPLVEFVSNIFHPNIYADGMVCLNILQEDWNSSYDVKAVLLGVQCLLDSPNLNSPANIVAASLYLHNKVEYNKQVRDCVNESLTEKRATM